MKRIFIYCALPLLTAACGRSGDFDATGTFEATEVVVSAEATGRILRFDAEEGDVLEVGRQVGAIDTVQLYLQKLQLERQRASVVSNRPDIAKQAASLREQIAAASKTSSGTAPPRPSSWTTSTPRSRC